MSLHPRALLPLLRDRLSHWPVTVLTGGRQTGKTTLVRDLLPEPNQLSSIYISLDDPDERLRLSSDPVRRLDHGNRLVILDEVQKLPLLMDAVKLLADRKKGHRFLLLGSSQILLLKQIQETLAGRATLLSLWPMALIERVEEKTVPESGLDRIWKEGKSALQKMTEEAPLSDTARAWRGKADEQLRWGGYPGLEPLPEKERNIWLRDFRRTYLERDLADLGRVADLDQFALAQNLLAARTGQLFSYSEVSRDLGVAVNTVKRYVRFLEISFQVFLLHPLLPTVTARLVKSPKLYWTDSGPARLLAERTRLDDGPLFETFILDELLRWISWQEDSPQIHFYRTHSGREIDFVLHSEDCLMAIEVKAGSRAHPTDARPIEELFETIKKGSVLQQKTKRCGFVITRGREIEQLSPNVWAIPDWRFLGPAS